MGGRGFGLCQLLWGWTPAYEMRLDLLVFCVVCLVQILVLNYYREGGTPKGITRYHCGYMKRSQWPSMQESGMS